jgi:hypothetical protein
MPPPHVTDYDDPQDLNDREALDARVRTFMRAHEEPDYGVALDRVLQLDELAAPAAEPAAPPDAESVFAGFVHAGLLEEGHRRLFLERYPPALLIPTAACPAVAFKAIAKAEGRKAERGAADQSADAVPMQMRRRGGTWRRDCSSSSASV